VQHCVVRPGGLKKKEGGKKRYSDLFSKRQLVEKALRNMMQRFIRYNRLKWLFVSGGKLTAPPPPHLPVSTALLSGVLELLVVVVQPLALGVAFL